MGALSDTMLGVSLMPLISAVHGERILVLTGLDAGKYFTGVREIEQDLTLREGDNNDPRAKVMLRFDVKYPYPRLSKTDRIKTDDGKTWNALVQKQANFLTEDFELVEIIAKDK